MEKKELSSELKLIAVTIFWGIGFPAMKITASSFTTFYQVGLRFLIASIVVSILFHRKINLLNKEILKKGLILSILLLCTYVSATKGVEYTNASRASFFCCLAVIIVPILYSIIYKKSIGIRIMISVITCAIGLFILSYTEELGLSVNLGDILCLFCSLFTALHIIATAQFVKNSEPTLLTMVQMTFTAIFAFIIAAFSEPFPTESNAYSIYALLFIGIFGTGISFYLQTSSQQYISPTKVGIVFSLEPVNGAIASYLILGDSMGVQSIIGGGLIFLSLLFTEIKPKKSV